MSALCIICISDIHAQENSSIVRTGKSEIKISLNAYSFNESLLNYSKNSVGKKMSLFDLIDWCSAQGFDGVDITGYYFPNYPQVPDDQLINEVKRYAHISGIDITGTGIRNNFTDPDPQKRAADVNHIKEWIDVASKLGAPVIRIFAGRVAADNTKSWEEIADYMVESIKECVEYGKKKGVIIGIQNHADFLKTADETIKIVKKVNSKWFGVIVDTGSFLTPDPYVDIEKVMPYAVNYQLKESVFGAKSGIPIDLIRVMKIVKNSGYRGYLPVETLSNFGNKKYDPYSELPVFLKKVKKAKSKVFGK